MILGMKLKIICKEKVVRFDESSLTAFWYDCKMKRYRMMTRPSCTFTNNLGGFASIGYRVFYKIAGYATLKDNRLTARKP